ncbi:hypothetical protein PCE1_001479 [Barthelona sp. PCE]
MGCKGSRVYPIDGRSIENIESKHSSSLNKLQTPNIHQFKRKTGLDREMLLQSAFKTVTKPKRLRILCLTSNHGGTLPSNQELTSFLSQFKLDVYHMLIISSQECGRSAGQGALLPSRAAEFRTLLNEALPRRFVALNQNIDEMGSTHSNIYVSASLVSFFTDVSYSTVRLGLGNVLVNKGAIITAFSYDEIRFCIICCHLTAHKENYQERCNDLSAIMGSGLIERNQIDCCIIAGDLNFRSDAEDAQRTNFNHLLSKDQLNRLIATDTILSGFQEHYIHFDPTFKLKTNEQGEKYYATHRLPAWTDRVLYKVHEEINMHVFQYEDAGFLGESDHKTVFLDCVVSRDIKPMVDVDTHF